MNIRKRGIGLLLALCMALTLLPVHAFAANGDNFAMPAIGFKITMTPRLGAQTEFIYTESGKTLEVNLATYAYAYIRPYIKGVDPGASVPWKQHVYYTFEFLYI